LLNRRATQTLVDTVKNQGKGRGSRAVTIKNKEKEGEAELITLPDLTKLPSQIKTNDDFSYYL